MWSGLLLICLWLLPSPAWSQYEIEQERPFWLRGLLDVRIARGGRAPSWMDRGPGKTRYGGRATPEGLNKITRFTLAQLALEVGGTLPWELTSHAQMNLETAADDEDRPLLIEAYLRKEWGEWGKGWGLQTGVMNIPFSLEHTGPAWTSPYTLTPSALNTWLWEEIRLVGVEGEWWRVTSGGLRLGLLAGAGFGPDQLGKLLAVRGWVLSDYLSGVNGDLPLPQRGERLSVFDERDHRPAVYLWFTASDSQNRGELRFGYFDNLGDQGTRGVWETRFGTLGAIVHPLARMDLLVQYLVGETRTRSTPSDSALSAFYALLSYHYRGHRLSARYDVFRVGDLDGAHATRERGDGVTLAYFFEFGLHHRVGVEYTFLYSRRPARLRSDPSDDGWQLSYRFRY
ncbi:MAG: hypothetical protein ACREQ3_10215 [Candidatus Binatia bacterium]